MQVRALVQTFAGNILRQPGDVFDYEGDIGPGIEPVNKKTNAVAAAKVQAAIDEASAKAAALHGAVETAKEALAQNPGDPTLSIGVIDAENAAAEADKAAAALQGDSLV